MPYGTVNVDSVVNSDGVTSGGLYGFKNRIINGAMVIDQRNAGASVTPTNGAYTLDRWQYACDAASKLSFQQVADAPAGFTYSLKATSLSAYSLTSSEEFRIGQSIEGYNFADFAFGTASAKPVMMSFWVKSSLTGTFGVFLASSGVGRSYVSSYTINAANTWEQKTVAITGDTSGTWLTTNGIGIQAFFILAAGSNYYATPNTWSSSGSARTVSGQTQLVSTNAATFQVTGVQLEKGSTATSFDYRPYGTELALCQRYYQFYSDKRYNGNLAGSADIAMTPFNYAVATRSNATATIDTSPYSGDNNVSAITAGYISTTGFSIQAQKSTSGYFYSRFNVKVENEL